MIRKNLPGICIAFTCMQNVFAFTGQDDTGVDVHERIVADALGGTFTDANLKIIEKACCSQDRPGSTGLEEARRHFAEGKLPQALAYIDHEKKKALNFANDADTNEADRMRALYHLGLMLHTVQDFYSRTNYLETKLGEVKKGGSVDPYNIDLVDWTRLNPEAGYITAGAPTSDKNSPTSELGQKKLGSTTYFKAAKELAVRETERQWNLFEALVRVRYSNRATAILTALKKASCSTPLDIDKIEKGLDLPE